MPALLLLLASPAQEDFAPFYKFKKGTTWTYEMVRGDKDKPRKVVLEVVDEKEGKVHVLSKEYTDGEAEPKQETLVWYQDGLYLVWADLKDGKERPLVLIGKSDAKSGETWTGIADNRKEKLTVTQMGDGDVTVPAGTFKKARKLVIVAQDGEMKNELEVCLVSKVGMIRMAGSRAGGGSVRMELKEFKTP